MIKKLLVAFAILVSATSEASFVSPLQVDIDDSRRGYVVVTNDGLTPAIYEATPMVWGGDGSPQQVDSPESLIVMPSIVRLEPGAHQRFTVVSSSPVPSTILAYRLIIKESQEQANHGGVNLSVSYSLPLYDWPQQTPSESGEVSCTIEGDDHLLSNGSNHPVRVSRRYENIVPLTHVILPGQTLRVNQSALPASQCSELYERIAPSSD